MLANTVCIWKYIPGSLDLDVSIKNLEILWLNLKVVFGANGFPLVRSTNYYNFSVKQSNHA